MRFLHYSPDGQPIGDGQLHDVYDAIREESTDGTDTLTLTCADTIDKDDRILLNDNGTWAEWICTKPDTIRSDTQAYGTYTLENSLIATAGKAIPMQKLTGGAQGMLQQALADTEWAVGTVESNGVLSATITLEEDADANALIETIANTFDLEVETAINVTATGVAGRTVSLVAGRGERNASKTFRYSKDLLEIRRTVGATHPVTRLWVYGKTQTGENGEEGERITIESVNNGLKYLDADADTLRQWGRPGPNGERLPYEATATYDVDDPKELLRLGKGALAKRSRPTVQYEGSVVALGEGGLDAEGVRVGDTVRIIDTAFPGGLRLEGRILKLSRHLGGGAAATDITLGTITEPITKINQKVQSTVQQLWNGKGAWDDAANLTESYVTGVINGLNELMNATGGYVYLIPGDGLYVYDRPKRGDGSDRDATMAIHIGGGYFRIANSRKSDGTWAWRTMGTGAGLVADVIVAGILKGGNSWWNLETGEMEFTEGLIHNARNDVSIDLDTGEVRLGKGRITGLNSSWDLDTGEVKFTEGLIEGGNSSWNLSTGELDLRDGTIAGKNSSWNLGTGEINFAKGLIKGANSSWDLDTGKISFAKGLIEGGSSSWNLDTGDLLFNQGKIRSKNGNVVIDLDTGQVTLKGGRITDGTHYWDLSSGTLELGQNGEIRISGYVGGYNVTTIIDSSGFRITSGGNTIGGVMVAGGSAALRASVMGPSSSTYMKMSGSDLIMVGSGSEILHIKGTGGICNLSTYSYSPFLSTGTQSGYPATTIYDGQGSSSSYFYVTRTALNGYCYGSQGGGSLTISGQGWAAVHGATLSGTYNGKRSYVSLENGNAQLIAQSTARVDLVGGQYAALVYGDNHVMVSQYGFNFTPSLNSASLASQAIAETKLIALADANVDLDSPDAAYEQMPVAISEIGISDIHDILRAIVDGDLSTAKTLLDEAEAGQKIWSRSDLDAMNIPQADPSLYENTSTQKAR